MADRSFIVEAIFRAQDNLSRTLDTLSGKAKQTSQSFNASQFKSATKGLDDLQTRIVAINQALASGNFVSAARQAGELAGTVQNLTKAAGEGESAAGGLAGALASFGPGALLAVAGVAALTLAVGALTKKIVDAALQGAAYAQSFGELGDRLGLTAEQVSRLSFAAQQSDTSITSVATALKFLSRNLQEARSGAGDARNMFLALGFSEKDLESGSITAEGALFKMADAVASINDPMQRVALTTKLLGRSAEDLVPLLARGSAGIRELGAESDRAHATVSSLQAEIGDRFEKSVRALNAQTSELKAQLGEGVVPALSDFVRALSGAVAGAENMIDGVNGLSKSITGLDAVNPSTFFIALERAAEQAFPAVAAIRNAVEILQHFKAPDFSDVKRGHGGTATPDFGKVLIDAEARALAAATSGNLEKIKTARDALLKAEADAINNGVAIDFDKAKAALDQLDSAQSDAANAAKDHAKHLAELRAEMDKLVASTENLAVTSDVANKLFEIDPDAASKMIRAINDAINKVEQGTATKDLKRPVVQLAPDVDFADKAHATAGPEMKIFDTAELEKIKSDLGISGEEVAAIAAELTRAGINARKFFDQLIAAKTTFGSIRSEIILIADAVGAQLDNAFDPTLTALDSVSNAVGNLKSEFDGAFSSAIDKIVEGQTSMLKFQNVIEGAFKAMERFTLEIIAAIAKAIILKALGFGVFSSGGTASSSGEDLVNLSRGGVIHAAGGFTVSGAASRIDRWPALLASGETVLPNTYSGRTPLEVVQNIDASNNIISQLLGRLVMGGAGGRGSVVNVNVSAFDADSIERSFRRGGRGAAALERAVDEGRLDL